MPQRKVAALVQEFKQAGQTEYDARRSAFCVLALHQGWSVASIARYLGMSRQGAGQRIHWIYSLGTKRIARLLDGAACERDLALPVGFPATNWVDEDFAYGVLDQLAA